MKVLLLNGSPHKVGCTYTALHEIEITLQIEGIDTELMQLGTQPIHGCIACGKCQETGTHRCVFKDDPVNKILDALDTSDGFIVGSPVYYASANGALVALLDRIFYAGNAMAYKPGAAVVSARRGGTTAAFDQLNKYFSISNMPIVSSQYWNMVHGMTPEEVRQDLEGLQIMRTLGKNMAWLLKLIQAGKTAGITPPTREDALRTNFIR